MNGRSCFKKRAFLCTLRRRVKKPRQIAPAGLFLVSDDAQSAFRVFFPALG
jgi:hypothetical protein